jgi:hypothetical protein
MSTEVRDAQIRPLGYIQLTSLSAATGLTAAQVPVGTKALLIQAETQNVRYRDDFHINATNPTAAAGFIIPSGSSIWYNGFRFDSAVLVFIETAVSAKLNILFYG